MSFIIILLGFWLLHNMYKDVTDMWKTTEYHKSTHPNPKTLKMSAITVSTIYLIAMTFIAGLIAVTIYATIFG